MSTYQQMPGFVSARVGDELAVLDVENGSYLGFNATATFVWRLLERPHSVDQLCAAMETEFDVETGRCRSEISTLLGKLREAGLIKECNPDVS